MPSAEHMNAKANAKIWPRQNGPDGQAERAHSTYVGSVQYSATQPDKGMMAALGSEVVVASLLLTSLFVSI